MPVERIRVLLVEDDPSQIAVIQALLGRATDMDFHVTVASRIAHALEHLIAGEIDIVLLDLSLPDGWGLDTFLRVRRTAPKVPVVVLTGNDDQQLALDTMAQGAQDYLVKGDVEGRLLVRSIRYSLYRIRAEEKLNEQRRRHRLLMESIPDVRIYFKDLHGRFLEVNHALAALYGFSDPAHAAGLTDYDLFTKEHADLAAQDEQLVIHSGVPLIGKVEKEILQNGDASWALTTKMPLQDDDGRTIGIFGISRDVTALKKSEEDLKAAVDNLTRANKELKETQMLLIQAEKLQSLGQMAASVAHEIKNPLAILHMGIECLSENPGNDGGEQMAFVLKEMKDAADRAGIVIRDMLDYSSARDFEVREVCPNALVTQTLRFVKHDLAKSKVRVVTQFKDGICKCLLDLPKMEQVLINIFTNACHALKKTGGTLTITTSEDTVEIDDPPPEREDDIAVRFLKGEKLAVLEILDNGPGIPADVLKNIYTPFFTTKPAGEGDGLGMAVVKSIVTLHKGKIRIGNAEGGGARVRIWLRCAGGNDE